MNRFEIYHSFSLDELLNEESFISLVNNIRTDSSLQKEWESFLSTYPDAGGDFREAAEMIYASAGVPIHVSPKSRDRVWKAIAGNINKPFLKPSYIWWRVAAIIVVILSIAGIGLWNTQDTPSIVKWETTNGQSKLITLPDGTEVMLKENSTISYKQLWAKDLPREVWIEGQAHFDVKHLNINPSKIKSGEKFIVHVGDDIKVTVLGTVFNVKSALLGSSVELESGSIEVGFTDSAIKESVLLKPGEKLEFKEKTKTFIKLKSAENDPSAGKSGDAVELKNTSVNEIIEMVERTYKKKIQVSDSSILNRKLDGSFPIYSEKDVWFVLSNILDIDVVIVNDDVLEFRPRN